MNGFFALYRRELQAYTHSLLSYLFIVVFLVVLSWLFWKNIFLIGQTSMRDFFGLLPWFYLFLLPALSMRTWSEEKKNGTIEKILTFPVSDTQAILAKFFASFSFLGVVLLFSLPIPLTLARIGSLDWGPVIGSYVGAWLLGGAYLALGQWVSGLTKNQIIAFLLTSVIGFAFLMIGLPGVNAGGGILASILYTLSTYTHFFTVAKGVIDLRDVVYYLSFIILFLFLNVQTLQKRKEFVHKSTQVFLFIGTLVLVNVLMRSVVVKMDLTEEKLFTLSDASRTVVQELPDPVTIKVFFSEELPQDALAVRQDVRDLIQEYERAGKGQVSVEFIDPKKDSAAQKDAQSFGVPEIQFNVVGSEKLEVSTGYAGLAILYHDDSEALPVIKETSSLEYDITSAIYRMSKDELPEIAFLTGVGEESVSVLESLLEKQYVVSSVTSEDLATTTAQNLVIPGATGELTDQQMYAIDQFLMKGGNVFVLIDGMIVDQQFLQVTENTTKLRELLAAYGVTVNADIVADFGSAETLTFGGGAFSILQEYPLWPRIVPDQLNREHLITQKLQSMVFPWASSLSIQAPQGVAATELVHSTPYTQPLADIVSATPDAIPTPQEDLFAPQLLAALLSGSFESAFSAKEKPEGVDATAFIDRTERANLFVVGDAQFVGDDLLQQSSENAFLVLNAVDAVTQDASLLTIRSRTALNRPLSAIDDSRKTVIRYGNIFSSVILVGFGAGIMYMMRKKKDKKAQKMYA